MLQMQIPLILFKANEGLRMGQFYRNGLCSSIGALQTLFSGHLHGTCRWKEA